MPIPTIPHSEHFGKQAKSALLIANGEALRVDFLRILASEVDLIVCADGGAEAARSAGILPHFIIGDFDSVTQETLSFFRLNESVRCIRIDHQHATDFEKALLYLQEQRIQRLAITGITGKLLDHTFGNFSILARHARSFEAIIFENTSRIDVLHGSKRFESRPGERISIEPLMNAAGVSYKGLRFDLTTGSLLFGENEGTCNEALSDSFEINLDSGILLVFRELRKSRLNFSFQ